MNFEQYLPLLKRLIADPTGELSTELLNGRAGEFFTELMTGEKKTVIVSMRTLSGKTTAMQLAGKTLFSCITIHNQKILRYIETRFKIFSVLPHSGTN